MELHAQQTREIPAYLTKHKHRSVPQNKATAKQNNGSFCVTHLAGYHPRQLCSHPFWADFCAEGSLNFVVLGRGAYVLRVRDVPKTRQASRGEGMDSQSLVKEWVSKHGNMAKAEAIAIGFTPLSPLPTARMVG